MKQTLTLAIIILTAVLAFSLMAGAASASKNIDDDRVKAIIIFKETVMPTDLTYLADMGGTIKSRYKSIPGVTVELPKDSFTRIMSDYANNNISDSTAFARRIESIEEDRVYHNVFSSTGGGPLGSQPVTWNIQRVNAPAAWAYSRGSGVKVAVLDSGIDDTHPDLDVKGGVSFVDYTTSYKDDKIAGHGTQCAGIIAALDNDEGVVGVAPEASIYAVKVVGVLGMGEDEVTTIDWIVAGIDWAIDHDVQVVSMSFGIPDGSPALRAVCQLAYDRGIILVACAGNDDGPIAKYPARYSSVIAVTATDPDNNRVSNDLWGSNFGHKAELAAPGYKLNSTCPVSMPGADYSEFGGTSAATPHVAGVAALLKAMYPAWNADQIRKRLDSTATDLGDKGRDVYYGYGLVNAYKAVHPFPVFIASPRPGEYRITPYDTVTLNFEEKIDREFVTQSSIVVRDSRGNIVPGTISTDGDSVTFMPRDPLAFDATYTVTADGIRSRRGELMDEYKWSFTTASPTRDASLVSISCPSFVKCGTEYRASVTVNNTGTVAWEPSGPGTGYSLGAYSDAPMFGGDVGLPDGTIVYPGQTCTFDFTVRAPASEGRYELTYRMSWGEAPAVAGAEPGVSVRTPFGEDISTVVVVDSTPPTLNVAVPTDGGSYLLHQKVQAGFSACDALSGVALVDAGGVKNGDYLDTGKIGPGQLCITAKDNAGNSITSVINYTVVYGFTGLLAPFNEDGATSVKAGERVPIRFTLSDANEKAVDDATVRLFVQEKGRAKSPNGIKFAYDKKSGWYTCCLDTKGMKPGSYVLIVALDDGTTKKFWLTVT